jgi:phospholipid transport system substrate-binding protein
VVVLLSVFLSNVSLADKIKQSQSLVIDIFNDLTVVSTLNLNKLEQKQKLSLLFEKYMDIDIIARAVLGNAWRKASSSERKAFIFEFKEYISNKYGRQFSDFKGTKLKIHKSRDTGTKAGVLVSSYITIPNRELIKVIWQVSDGSGYLKLVDIKVEGISMLSTERQEFRSKLKKASGSINELIIKMREASS